MSNFGLTWRPYFANIFKSRFFFKNPPLSLFYLFSPLTSCKKSEKSLEPFRRKLRYQPTNQPTNHYQQHRFYRTSLTPVQNFLNLSIRICQDIIRLCKNYIFQHFYGKRLEPVYLNKYAKTKLIR